ncbi:uncharacterized protein LOC126844881 [Adelges cooleyi]|uniref:uncharacterized protein LOC126844881 n=1 Tax=Adelges cooleyi TaxID=133065 RepID=UPI00218011AB|nr:uncharacterized protein LOC126844881 [Adelges cooleyi]XP_050439297.1 uncharacterized protein LOC126844881 [Adelges cooleyi]
MNCTVNNSPPGKCCGCCCCNHFWYCVSNKTKINYCVDNNIFDTNDHTKLVPECGEKHKNNHNHSKLKSRVPSHHLIALIHIFCTAALVLLAILWTSNIFSFRKNTNSIKMADETVWRLFTTSGEKQHVNNTNYLPAINLTTSTTTPSPTPTPSPNQNDKCEPLYALVYAHCCVWFLFLILDHVARHLHHKTLRCRGHLRAYARLTRLAAIPFQLVSLWTVLLAIFIAIYAQQDKADMQPYCDANMLMSPKNGVAVLLIIEFLFVSISSLVYANSMRKFNVEKPPPDVCGWEEDDNIYDRWTPRPLRSDSVVETQSNTRNYLPRISSDQDFMEQRDSRCILDLLEYYAHANRELAANLGKTSHKLRQLELELRSQVPQQTSMSEIAEDTP